MITAASINILFAVLNPIAYSFGGVSLLGIASAKYMDRKERIVKVRTISMAKK